ncbi:MAG TPA: PLP-dependent aminotransferase family protein [Candidatus Limnocylindria bacterium]|jgi:2-aminoadipate transaminase|nr:PLP-dependent aminotransferase family protein [Candidatus Limnocylindria bacterium]
MNWPSKFSQQTARMRRSAVRELLKLTAQPDMISFAGGLPAPELFPVQEIQAAAEVAMKHQGARALQYGETEGIAELRDWLATQHSTPWRKVHRSNVLITSGAQQALDLFGRIFIDPGDRVLVEDPTYLALLSAWRPLQPEFVGIPGDDGGLDLTALKGALPGSKVLYTIPNFQNPQGTTLALDRRQQVVDLVQATGTVILEDDPYGMLRYSGRPLPSLFELEAQSSAEGSQTPRWNTILVGTFSKVFAPGFRLGWAIGPEAVIDKMVQAKQAMDLHTSTYNQIIAMELVRQGVLDRQLPRLRRAYGQRRDAMLAALDRHMPAGVRWTRPEGGMFLFATLPEDWDATTLLAECLHQKVAFVPGEEFHTSGRGRNTLRLNFSNATPELIEEGIRRMGSVFGKHAALETRPALEANAQAI